jgi:hypothetical protein
MTIYELFVYIINLPWWTIPLAFFSWFLLLVGIAVAAENRRY